MPALSPTPALLTVDEGLFGPSRTLERVLGGIGRQGYAKEPWAKWLLDVAPTAMTLADGTVDFAEFHRDMWAWLFGVGDGRPMPFIGAWPRDTGKSTHAELGCIYLGCEDKRAYALYVCDTQSRADDHVGNVAALLESDPVAQRYPQHSERLVGKFSQSRGWRVSRVRTAGGFTIDAIGLDKAVRGARLEQERPSIIIFDDIDDKHDTPRAVAKKIEKITTAILPAGNRDNVVIPSVDDIVSEVGDRYRKFFWRWAVEREDRPLIEAFEAGDNSKADDLIFLRVPRNLMEVIIPLIVSDEPDERRKARALLDSTAAEKARNSQNFGVLGGPVQKRRGYQPAQGGGILPSDCQRWVEEAMARHGAWGTQNQVLISFAVTSLTNKWEKELGEAPSRVEQRIDDEIMTVRQKVEGWTQPEFEAAISRATQEAVMSGVSRDPVTGLSVEELSAYSVARVADGAIAPPERKGAVETLMEESEQVAPRAKLKAVEYIEEKTRRLFGTQQS